MAILITSTEVREILGINRNNLYQIQYRGQIKWVEKKAKMRFMTANKLKHIR